MEISSVQAYYDSEGHIKKISISRAGDSKKKVNIVIGGTYIVNPLNPLKKKHRDRIVTVRKFIQDNRDGVVKASVKFQDNNRVGRIDLMDLVDIHENKGIS